MSARPGGKVVPRATARLQFNREFTFDQAREILPYVAKLGISHVYASPILAARPGSTHGYDTTDPTRINPELGGEEGLARLSEALRRLEMGLIIDIVPNHMAADAANPWWWDVLLNGRASRYGAFFDIDWEDPDPELHGKILLPVLGDRLEACLDRGEIKLTDDRAEPELRYFDQRFPIDPKTLSGETPAGAEALLRLLGSQHYLLSPWREAAWRIDWRRFFDINQLVALSMDREPVFEASHGLVLDLVRQGVIDGVRVDHVDGLAAPLAYCRRLREALRQAGGGREPYLVIEKILASDEELGADWQVDGTTGYDFMEQVSALLHDPRGEAPLDALWQAVSGDARSFDAVAADARNEILMRLFPKQLDRLITLMRVASGADADHGALRTAVIALLAAMRRYRFYGDARGFDASDSQALEAAIATANGAGAPAESLEIVRAALGHAAVRQRFGQLSATLAAKAVEDTAFYRYHRLISRNEVGGDPALLSMPVADFHQKAGGRRDRFPAAMLTTATHDQKRGEDVRARLAVLSEIGDEWSAVVRRWLEMLPPPDPSVGLMILQTVIGAWPLDLRASDEAGRKLFRERLSTWLVKALREAKGRTSWDRPDETFERASLDHLRDLTEGRGGVLPELESFVARVAPAGAVNSLAQTMLRLTQPGVPDLYQGTEFWDFSLVDPDNRRPVDFAARVSGLETEASPAALISDWRDGRIKQAIIARLLDSRRRNPGLFAGGSYEPVPVSGPRADHVVAFLRQDGRTALLVLASRWMSAPLLGAATLDVSRAFWEGTTVTLPRGVQHLRARDLLLDRTLEARSPDLSGLLSPLPLAAVEFG
jgi:malto-oligosyltrehalose synthase